MKKILAGILTGVLILSLTGCGGNTAGSNTAEVKEAPAPEAAPAEEAAATTDVIDDMEDSGDEDIPFAEDFVQDQSGKLEFKDYDEIISCLKDGQGYAYIKLYGSDKDFLAVAETVFEADNSAPDRSLYGMRDGKPVFMGVMTGNGSAYPVRLSDDGIIYCGDNHRYDTYFLGPDGNGIMQKDYVDDGVNEGTGKFVGFLRKSNDYDHDEEFKGGQEEFDALISERESVPIIVFTRVGDTGSASGSLPEYKYTGTDELEKAVYEAVVSEYGKNFEKADVCIPNVRIGYKDESNEDDIVVMGDFYVWNYNLNGDTLECESGGSFPGAIHLKKDGDKYTVIKTEVVEDGSAWTDSAKKIFGKHYDEVMKVVSDDDESREKDRAKVISDYVKANGLNITQYKDYGWDPVKLDAASGEEGNIHPPVIVDMEKYNSVISTLPKGSYIAFAELNKDKEGKNDVMLVAKTETLFDNGKGEKVCTEAKIYGIDKNGKIKEYGEAISGGTAIPLSLYNGCLYFGNHQNLTHVYIDEEKDELVSETGTSFDDLDHVDEIYFFSAE
jgi:hypothetical protein